MKASRTTITGIAALVMLLISLPAYSQGNCDCKQSLEQLISKMESEYPGFKEKTGDAIVYGDFKERLLIESENTKKSDCYDLLNHYLSYFRDGHGTLLQVNETQIPQADHEPGNMADITLDDFYEHISTTSGSEALEYGPAPAAHLDRH